MDSEGRSKRTKSLDAPLDLISNLPRDVIDGIMQHLPLHDAARLMVLSRQWRDIWLSTPQLVFDAPFFSRFIQTKRDATYKFCSIVSQLLNQHQGPILKFSLYIPPLIDCPNITDQWLWFLSRNGVRDFTLLNHHKSYVSLSSHIFCVGMEKLELRHCQLDDFSFSGLRKLVSLDLVDVSFGIGAFEHLIASCPLLEELNLTDCQGCVATIEAPNLKHLVSIGNLLPIKKSENLLSASIDLGVFFTKRIGYKTILRSLIDAFANSAKLEKLSFGRHFYRFFEECRVHTTFGSLKILELSSIDLFDLDCFYSVVRAIQTCPNIERLDISVHWSTDWDVEMLNYNPDITLNNLRWAKVAIFYDSDMELKLIELLLASSPVLETLSVSLIEPAGEFLELKLLSQLIQFRRASPKVEVIGPDASQSSRETDSSSESSTDSDSSSDYSSFSDDSS